MLTHEETQEETTLYPRIANMYAIIGAGITGATIARQLADAGKYVVVYESHPYPGGHAADENKHGTLVSKYGVHVFHTNNERVWSFVNQHSSWTPFTLLFKTKTAAGWLPWPVNRTTIETIMHHAYPELESDAFDHWKQEVARAAIDPRYQEDTFEHRAIRAMGPVMYEYTSKYYSERQWQRPGAEIPKEVFSRFRFKDTTDPRFFADKYVALPADGYTEWVRSMLNHSNITVAYSKFATYSDIQFLVALYGRNHVICTAPIDEMLKYEFGELDYLRVKFVEHVEDDALQKCEDWPSHVSNFPQADEKYTRGTAYHRLWQSSYPVVVFEEPGSGEKLYPVRTEHNMQLYARYKEKMEKEGVMCAGRLGGFEYIDMYQAIERAFAIADHILS